MPRQVNQVERLFNNAIGDHIIAIWWRQFADDGLFLLQEKLPMVGLDFGIIE